VLTSSILEESGFGISRYTSVARRAQKLGLWKKDRLPISLDEAAEGFSLVSTPNPLSNGNGDNTK
jgi:hypothetical protein